MPVPVTLIELNESARYSLDDFEPYIDDIPTTTRPATTTGKGTFPPPTPERLAQADDLAQSLGKVDTKFAATWRDKGRADLSDQSLSGYDQALANLGVDADLDDQQIADLIYLRRSKYGNAKDIKKALRRDYIITRTISKARAPSSGGTTIDTLVETFDATIDEEHTRVGSPLVDVDGMIGAGSVVVDGDATRLPEEFWERPRLARIRQAAQARQVSPEAVLVAVLARVAAITPPSVTIPAIVGAESTLTIYSALAAPTGGAKTTPAAIARELLPVPWSRRDKVVDGLPIGSGEGFTDCLFEMVKEGTGRTPKNVKQKIYDGAYFTVDEGTVLNAFNARNGNTTVQAMCTGWTGAAPSGQKNATAERTRVVPPYSAAWGVVMGIQPANAGALFGHTVSGLPGRFVYASSIDPTLPDHPPEWPGQLEWAPPSAEELQAIEIMVRERVDADEPDDIHHVLNVDPTIAEEVLAAHLARSRGLVIVDDLDGHAHLVQLKLAAGVMLLDDRLTITTDDWALAAMVMTMSNAVRANVITTMHQVSAQTEAQTNRRRAASAVVTKEALDQADERKRAVRIIDCANKMAVKVHNEPDRWTVRTMQQTMRRHRDVFHEALDHATTEEWITEHNEHGQGDDKRALRPGPRKP